MARNTIKLNLPRADDLFTTQAERDLEKGERVISLNLDEIVDYPEHPFKVRHDQEMEDMVESIKQYGVLVPGLARPLDDGTIQMVSGHRRKYASELAGKKSICLSVFQRIIKIIFAAPTGALAISTIAGGRELSRTASAWFQKFLAVVLEASFMVLAIGVCVPIMAIPLFPGSGVVNHLMSIIEPAFKMVLMSTAVHGSSAMFRKFLWKWGLE